jgi:hypothetical protein
MSNARMQQLILLGLAGAAIYYLFFRSPVYAFPGSVAVTPINPGLIPPPAQPQPVELAPGWLTGANAFTGTPSNW